VFSSACRQTEHGVQKAREITNLLAIMAQTLSPTGVLTPLGHVPGKDIAGGDQRIVARAAVSIEPASPFRVGKRIVHPYPRVPYGKIDEILA